MLYFDRRIEELLTKALPSIIKQGHVFALQVLGTDRQEVAIADDKNPFVSEGMAFAKTTAQSQITARGRHYGYSDFLKKASKKTNIPLHTLHQAIMAVAKDGMKITDEMMNEDTLTRLIMAVDSWKSRTLAGQVRYKQAHYRVKETKLTHADGTAKNEVVQAYIGTKREPGEPPAKYLYDAYDNETQMAQDEERKIDCAEEFFHSLQADGYDVRFRRQLNTSGVKAIINELIQEDEV